MFETTNQKARFQHMSSKYPISEEFSTHEGVRFQGDGIVGQSCYWGTGKSKSTKINKAVFWDFFRLFNFFGFFSTFNFFSTFHFFGFFSTFNFFFDFSNFSSHVPLTLKQRPKNLPQGRVSFFCSATARNSSSCSIEFLAQLQAQVTANFSTPLGGLLIPSKS